jgi:hypothetical protein
MAYTAGSLGSVIYEDGVAKVNNAASQSLARTLFQASLLVAHMGKPRSVKGLLIMSCT